MNIIEQIPLLLGQPPSGEGGGGSGAFTLITFGLVFVVFYLLIIRPQSKRNKETKKMLANLKKGDKVVTIGGIHGVVKSLTDEAVTLKVSGDITLEFSRSAISRVIS